MGQTYGKYDIEERKGFYGIYYDGRFIESVVSLDDAKTFVNVRCSDRTPLLVKCEINAMANAALAKIDKGIAYGHHKEWRKGYVFFEHAIEAESQLELDIVKSTKEILHLTVGFEYGFNMASEHELFLDSANKEEEAIREGNERYYKQLELQKESKRNHLAFSALKLIPKGNNLSCYEELIKLPVKARSLLAEMEEINIDIADCADEYIEGNTGGHHREIRDILDCAAKSKPMNECYADIYMDKDGQFNFDLIKHTANYAEKHDPAGAVS